MDRILVVDDEPMIVGLMRDWLEAAGYEVIEALHGRSALRQFFHQRPDLILIDILMPDMDGLELCRRIREVSEVPIIILSALEREHDKVRGLRAGADDYIAKTAGHLEMVARVEAALRRARMPSSSEEPRSVYGDGEVSIDFRNREVCIRGENVSLTPLEYGILAALVNNVDHLLTPDQLLDLVWGMGSTSADVVKWHISHLRRKIEMNPLHPELIVTIRGAGYIYRRPRLAGPGSPSQYEW